MNEEIEWEHGNGKENNDEEVGIDNKEEGAHEDDGSGFDEGEDDEFDDLTTPLKLTSHVTAFTGSFSSEGRLSSIRGRKRKSHAPARAASGG